MFNQQQKQKMGKESAEIAFLAWQAPVEQGLHFSGPFKLPNQTKQEIWAPGEPLTPDPTALTRFEVREKELNTVHSVSPSMGELGSANTNPGVFGRRSRWGQIIVSGCFFSYYLFILFSLQTTIIW